MKSKKPGKPKVKSLPKLKDELDKVFSIYIRMKYSDENGYARCYTCGKADQWKYLHCGHFIDRGKLPTRWDESNCRPQDYACNIAKKGNYPVFASNLMREYGPHIVDALIERAHSNIKYLRADYEEMIDHYKGEVNKLKINLEI